MYVVSARSKWVPGDKDWVFLDSPDGQPPANPAAPADTFPDGFIASVKDPLVVIIHGYNNTEVEAFQTYAGMIGVAGAQGRLADNRFTGTAIGYDWPSVEAHASDPLGIYTNDVKAAYNIGAPVLGSFLTSLSTALAGKNVQIKLLAHSMGNLVLRGAFESDGKLAGKVTDVVSLAPDLVNTDLQRPAMKKACDGLLGNWFVYWAQADLMLLMLSNYANIIVGNEPWGGQRLGQQGPAKPPPPISKNIVAQDWDVPLAKQVGNPYNWDLGEWKFTFSTHSAYWTNPEFLSYIVKNFQRPAGGDPITVNWPIPSS